MADARQDGILRAGDVVGQLAPEVGRHQGILGTGDHQRGDAECGEAVAAVLAERDLYLACEGVGLLRVRIVLGVTLEVGGGYSVSAIRNGTKRRQ